MATLVSALLALGGSARETEPWLTDTAMWLAAPLSLVVFGMDGLVGNLTGYSIQRFADAVSVAVGTYAFETFVLCFISSVCFVLQWTWIVALVKKRLGV